MCFKLIRIPKGISVKGNFWFEIYKEIERHKLQNTELKKEVSTLM